MILSDKQMYRTKTERTIRKLIKPKGVWDPRVDIARRDKKRELLTELWTEAFAERAKNIKYYFKNLVLDWHMQMYLVKQLNIIPKFVYKYAKLKCFMDENTVMILK